MLTKNFDFDIKAMVFLKTHLNFQREEVMGA